MNAKKIPPCSLNSQAKKLLKCLTFSGLSFDLGYFLLQFSPEWNLNSKNSLCYVALFLSGNSLAIVRYSVNRGTENLTFRLC